MLSIKRKMLGTQSSSSEESQLKALGSGGLMGAVGANTPRPMSDIESAFARQTISIDILENKVSILRTKLNAVMLSIPENVAKASTEFNGSPLAQEIESKTDRLRNLDKELCYILDSLQL